MENKNLDNDDWSDFDAFEIDSTESKKIKQEIENERKAWRAIEAYYFGTEYLDHN